MPKNDTLKARLPRGFIDRSAAEIRATERMLAVIRGVYERYGFEPVETPLIEYTDALGKFLPDQDRPNEGVFSFRDEEQEARSGPRVSPEASPRTGSAATGTRGEWLSLRYDLTAPLARYVAENYERLPKPYRSYRVGWVFRNEKPGPGRYRQFLQFDADTVGAASVAADAEMCMMAADTLEELGIPRGQYVIKVSSRKVLDGVMEAIGLGGPEDAGRRLTVLRAIDKLDRLGVDGVRELLGPGRKDESGDSTRGAKLDAEQVSEIIDLIDAASIDDEIQGTVEIFPTISEARMFLEEMGVVGEDFDIASSVALKTALESKFMINSQFRNGVAELIEIARQAHSAGYELDRIRIDPSVVRGLEYYTGPVFEAELLFEVPNDQGQPVVFGSVGGGGRYDGLVGRFMKEDVPATGFSIGVSRLQAALAALNKAGAVDEVGPVVVLVMDRARVGEYQAMVSRLREAGVATEMYLGSAGMKAQMKYADRRNAPLVVIQGGDEKAKGVVQVKDLAEGKRLATATADHAAWRSDRPGQFEVPEADLVAAVQKLVEARR